MTVADTPAIGFGAGERTLEGAGHLAREMCDLAVGENDPPTGSGATSPAPHASS